MIGILKKKKRVVRVLKREVNLWSGGLSEKASLKKEHFKKVHRD